MKQDTDMRYTGFDRNGIARVYAENANPDVAETACKDEAMAYVRRRPDTGPLSAWTFTHNKPLGR